MKALVVEKAGALILRQDVPTPRINDYQALCKNLACGVCNGTDLKLLRGQLRDASDFPCVLGHESVGEVIRVGKKVRNFAPGDRVLRSTLKDTPALKSRWGGFAQYGFVDDYAARMEDGVPADEGYCTHQVLPDGVDAADGVMIVTLKEVASALVRLGMTPGMDVAVAGDGPVGLAMAASARLMGARHVILTGHHPKRLETARQLGANRVIDTRAQSMEEAVKALLPSGLDLFVDCVGRAQIVNQAMRVIKECGVIALYGIGLHTGDEIDWDRFPYNFNLHSVQWPIAQQERAVHAMVCDWVSRGKIDLKKFVTHRLPVEAFERGFALVENREALKVALTFWE